MICRKILFMIIGVVSLTGCATVDGMRTDVGNGVTWVGDKIKPCTNQKCKNER